MSSHFYVNRLVLLPPQKKWVARIKSTDPCVHTLFPPELKVLLFIFTSGSQKIIICSISQFILFFYYDPTQSLQNHLNCPSLMSPSCGTSYHIPSKLILLIFGWLLRSHLLFGGHLRPWLINVSTFLSTNLPPQTMPKFPPDTFRHGRMPSPIPPPIAKAIFWLVVVWIEKMVAT